MSPLHLTRTSSLLLKGAQHDLPIFRCKVEPELCVAFCSVVPIISRPGACVRCGTDGGLGFHRQRTAWTGSPGGYQSRPFQLMGTLWKEAFPVGTEWDQYDKVYEINWDFTNLEKEFEEGGKLYGKRVYLFGCTEPQLVHFAENSRVIHIPAVVAVTSPFPPSDKIGIKSVQREEELIVPMKEMKMDWVPFIPPDVREFSAVERVKTQIFTLKCTQRRAALKQLKQERIKKYEYCLPYIYSPLKEDETVDETVVNIMYPFDDETKPPVVCEFDWQFDEFEEFVDNLVTEEELPESEKEKFMVFLKDIVGKERKKVREAKQARKKALETMSKDLIEGFQNMKFYKFYPIKSEKYPDISEMKSSFINRYYGRATEVL